MIRTTAVCQVTDRPEVVVERDVILDNPTLTLEVKGRLKGHCSMLAQPSETKGKPSLPTGKAQGPAWIQPLQRISEFCSKSSVLGRSQ